MIDNRQTRCRKSRTFICRMINSTVIIILNAFVDSEYFFFHQVAPSANCMTSKINCRDVVLRFTILALCSSPWRSSQRQSNTNAIRRPPYNQQSSHGDCRALSASRRHQSQHPRRAPRRYKRSCRHKKLSTIKRSYENHHRKKEPSGGQDSL